MNQMNSKRYLKDSHHHNHFFILIVSLTAHWDDLRSLIHNLHSSSFSFDFIGLSETFKVDSLTNMTMEGYHSPLFRIRTNCNRGGVGLFIKESYSYTVRDDLSVFIPHVIETLFVEFKISETKKAVLGVIYRPNTAPKADLNIFTTTLLEIINLINNEHKQCILMGDFNIDLLQYNNHNATNNFLDDMFSLNLIPSISKATRVTHQTATSIDNIYTSNIVNTSTSGIIITDLSDHFGVFLIEQNTQKNAHTKIPEYKRIRKFNDSNMNIFRNSLGQHDFRDVFMSTCPDEAYDKFMQILKTTYDQAFPSHLIRLTKKDYKRDPWITHGLEKSAKTKQKLYKNKLRNPNQSNIERYKAYNRIYNKVKRLLKKEIL